MLEEMQVVGVVNPLDDVEPSYTATVLDTVVNPGLSTGKSTGRVFWLGLLDTIRTCGAPVLTFAAAWAGGQHPGFAA